MNVIKNRTVCNKINTQTYPVYNIENNNRKQFNKGIKNGHCQSLPTTFINPLSILRNFDHFS